VKTFSNSLSLFLLLFFSLFSVTCLPARAQDAINEPQQTNINENSGPLGLVSTLSERNYLLGSWDGKRFAKEDSGLSLELVYTGDMVTNHRGGLKRGTTYLGNIDLTATLDTEKAGLWERGTFFVYILNNHGGTPTKTHIGDLQTVSNIETEEATRFYELWYEHLFDWHGTLSFLIGQHDMNSEFNVTEYGGLFINSSFGIQPDISANAPVSIFSVAAPALRLKWETNGPLYLMAAIYDGDPGAPGKNKSGLRWRISSDEGAMTIYEIGYRRGESEKSQNLHGTYKLGLWYHTDEFDDIAATDTNGNPKEHEGNYGLYFVADQMLIPAEDDRGLGVFLQMGMAPDDRNQVDFYIGGGLHYHGLIPGRHRDTIGLGIAHASISDKLRRNAAMDKYETTVELTYRAQITPWLVLQPDLQIIFNPGAAQGTKNAIVSLLRFEASF